MFYKPVFLYFRHVQFTNGEQSGMQGIQPIATAGVRSGAGGGYSASGYTAHGMGYNSTHSSAMGGSRYNLHHAPVSPGAASYHGGMYHHSTGPPSVYHGASYGSRRGSMQSLVAASGMSAHLCLLSPFAHLSLFTLLVGTFVKCYQFFSFCHFLVTFTWNDYTLMVFIFIEKRLYIDWKELSLYLCFSLSFGHQSWRRGGDRRVINLKNNGNKVLGLSVCRIHKHRSSYLNLFKETFSLSIFIRNKWC